MRTYFKKMSSPVKICYLISAAAFALTFVVSVVLLSNVVPLSSRPLRSLLAVGSGIISVISALAVSAIMSRAVISTEYNLKGNPSFAYQIKRIGFIAGCIILFGFVASLVGGQILLHTIGIVLATVRQSHFAIFSMIIKVILFIILWIALGGFIKYFGDGDCGEKEFNPHLLIIAVLIGLTFLLPYTVHDHMFENQDFAYDSNGVPGIGMNDMGKTNYNVQTVFSQNQDVGIYKGVNTDTYTYKSNENFSIVWVIVSVILVSAAQVCIAAMFYYRGRKAYYKRHPNLVATQYSKEKV